MNDPQAKPITVDKLDELAGFVINPPPKSKLMAVIAGLKILVVFAYLFARKKLSDLNEEEVQKQKQEHEMARETEARAELKGDSLDGA